ncbi:hypothetical protein ACS0TY_012586 [Phlomoides rotata]
MNQECSKYHISISCEWIGAIKWFAAQSIHMFGDSLHWNIGELLCENKVNQISQMIKLMLRCNFNSCVNRRDSEKWWILLRRIENSKL